MGFSTINQGTEFLLALALGGVLGIVYDMMRITRGKVPLRIVTFLLDLLFWGISAAAAFGFAMTLGNGVLHLYALVGMIVGGTVYFSLISRYVRILGFVVLDLLSALFRTSAKPVRAVAGGVKNIQTTAVRKTKLYEIRHLHHTAPAQLGRLEQKKIKQERRIQRAKEKNLRLLGQSGGDDLRAVRGVSPDFDPSQNQRTTTRGQRDSAQNQRTTFDQPGRGGGFRV